MDADGPGQEGTAKFAKKLGVGRATAYLMIYVSFRQESPHHLHSAVLSQDV